MMAVKHSTVYHKDVMYVVAYSITINKVNDADDEYVFQMGFFLNVNRRKIHILKETVNSVYNGKTVLHVGTNIFAIFEVLYSKAITCSQINFEGLKKELLCYYP